MFNKPFIRELAKRSGHSQAVVHNVLVDYYDLMLEKMTELDVGERLTVREFGAFEKKRIKPRMNKSVNTGEWAMTNPKPYIVFIMCDGAKKKMNEEESVE